MSAKRGDKNGVGFMFKIMVEGSKFRVQGMAAKSPCFVQNGGHCSTPHTAPGYVYSVSCGFGFASVIGATHQVEA